MTEKISVIVPVYKVEAYLHKCLDSIVAQTYKNLEIILVDDGSPDSCGAICDEYAALDKRIIVIHQQNAGLSAARNAALDIATGDYIGFVDSDDWIEPDMYEYLLAGALEENADITICGRFTEFPKHTVLNTFPGKQVLDREAAMEMLLEDILIRNFVWDKLWRRELFDGVRFPHGRNFEDLATSWKCFEKAEKVLCLQLPKYHYLQRTGSIIHDGCIANRVQATLAALERCEAMLPNWPQFRRLLEAECTFSAINLWCSYYRSSKSQRRELLPEIERISAFARSHPDTLKNPTKAGRAGRFVLRLVPYPKPWAFFLAHLCSMAYKLKHGVPL